MKKDRGGSAPKDFRSPSNRTHPARGGGDNASKSSHCESQLGETDACSGDSREKDHFNSDRISQRLGESKAKFFLKGEVT